MLNLQNHVNIWHVPQLQYIPRNMHTVFALMCFDVVIHWLIFPYPPGLLHWHCGNLTIVPMPAKQPWWIWIDISCEFLMNDCITTIKQSTTKPCAYFLRYTVSWVVASPVKYESVNQKVGNSYSSDQRANWFSNHQPWSICYNNYTSVKKGLWN